MRETNNQYIYIGGAYAYRSPNNTIRNRKPSTSPIPYFTCSRCLLPFLSLSFLAMKPKFLSIKATCDSHGEGSSYFLGWQEYEKNPYDAVNNPQGIIQMGLAENQLSFDLLESWLADNPDIAGFKRNGASVFRELALFQDYHGLPAFKTALAEFMAEIRGNRAKFDPKNLVLTAGSTSANETLMFCIAGPGDAFLLPTPYYPGFDRDLKWRTGVEIVPIHCFSSNGFRITETALEAAFKEAHQRKLKVKGVLVTNPSNPLGTTMNSKELNILLKFITAKNIDLVCDEIYSGTVFDSPDFISISECLNHYKEARERVHIVYSLSKDLGLPGFRVGAIYSNNENLVATATRMSSFGLVSSQTQYLLSSMLSDKEFTQNYITENQKRLKQRQQMMVSGLQQAGTNCLKSNAGLFCWVDLRHLLTTPALEEEIVLWKKMLYEVGLNISPGSSCHCSEPGWFRVCFANMSEQTLNVALQRIKTFVDRNKYQRYLKAATTSKKASFSPKLWLTKWAFRLSSSDHESER